MPIEMYRVNAEASVNQRLTRFLFRIAALFLFGLGLFYWVRLVGVVDGPLWRFDLMPVGWRTAAPALAVLYPVAGVGLWTAAPWGVVVWVIVALAETVMVVGFPAVFGADPAIAIAHGVGLLALLALRLEASLRARRLDRV